MTAQISRLKIKATLTIFSEFHQIKRGCLNENFDSFVETDIQVGCWNDDFETEDSELQIPSEYRVENGNLQQLCRKMVDINL